MGGGEVGEAVGGRNLIRSQHKREETISESYSVYAKVALAFLKAFKFNFIR